MIRKDALHSLFTLIIAIGMFACTSRQNTEPTSARLQRISGFPDEEPGYSCGVSACYAGMIGEHLVMAGGCNFPENPAAEGGHKRFYKGIYAAKPSDDSLLIWKKTGELPDAVAYGVSVSLPDHLVFIGGNNSKGSLTSVYSLGRDLQLDTLPYLPCTLDNMAGVAIGNVIYVLGGNKNSKPSTAMYSLDLDQPDSWKEEPPFPGLPRIQPVCASVQNALYVWGGFYPATDTKESKVYTDGYQYLPDRKQWRPLPGPSLPDLKKYTLSGAAATTLKDSLIICVGGVNKDIFEDAISGSYQMVPQKEYLNKPVEWYRFNKIIWLYDTHHKIWKSCGNYAPTARAGAILTPYKEDIFCIGGEMKPGIRTPEIYRISLLSTSSSFR